MGADGGSIPDRRDLVRTKAKTAQLDKESLRELFILCILSRRPLTRPIVADPLGKLYNKDAVLEYFIDKSKYGDGEQICGYLKGVKDVLTLNLHPNPTYAPPDPSTTNRVPDRVPFVCPLTLKEMTGAVPFIALRPCGCVFSEAAVRAMVPNLARTPGLTKSSSEVPDEAKPVAPVDGGEVVGCPNCGQDIRPGDAKTVLPINPPPEVQDVLLEEMLAARAATKAGKKRKLVAAGVDGEAEVVKASKAAKAGGTGKVARHGAGKPGLAATGVEKHAQTVKQKLAEQEQKRLAKQANMSEAVRSMFKPSSDRDPKDQVTEFFGRTYHHFA